MADPRSCYSSNSISSKACSRVLLQTNWRSHHSCTCLSCIWACYISRHCVWLLTECPSTNSCGKTAGTSKVGPWWMHGPLPSAGLCFLVCWDCAGCHAALLLLLLFTGSFLNHHNHQQLDVSPVFQQLGEIVWLSAAPLFGELGCALQAHQSDIHRCCCTKFPSAAQRSLYEDPALSTKPPQGHPPITCQHYVVY